MHTIVVGAGIAGLWIAEQLAVLGDTVTVLEQADYLGGRVITSKQHGYEIGAGRVATRHKRVLALIKRFGLQTYPLSKGQLWKGLNDPAPSPNTFGGPFLQVLSTLKHSILESMTLRHLLTKLIGAEATHHFLIRFNYRAETETLRADLALHSFQEEMRDGAGFVGVKGGLSQIIDGLAKACRAAGVKLHLGCKVTDVNDDYTVHTTTTSYKADRVILALPSEALKQLPCTRSLPLLRYLKMEPLTRIYAQTAGPWPFKQRIVTDSPLRYIIPIAPTMVMISYTESQDTRRFKGLKDPELTSALQFELRRLFPMDPVPNIKWARAYEWSHGCTYWVPYPNPYNPATESKRALRPFPERPHLHLCNESFSLRQAWMEGSLEHAQALLDLIR